MEFVLIFKENYKEQFINNDEVDIEEELKILEEQQKEQEEEDKEEEKEEENEEENEEEKEEINHYVKNNQHLKIQVKLFESGKKDEKEYLVRFMKISGEKIDFYKNLDYMYYFAENILI